MDTSKWKWFCIDDFCDKPYKAKAYNANELTVCKKNDKESLLYITRTDVNNGSKCFVINENYDKIEKANAITIGDTTSTIYYQEREFICGDHMVILRSKYFNCYTGLFITTLLSKERYRYNYGRAFTMNNISSTKLKLPVTPEGTPNWQYMEDFIKKNIILKLPSKANNVWLKTFDTKPLEDNKKQLNTESWKWFKYDEIFDIKHGFYNKKPEDNPEGNIPFIGATDSNNGVTSHSDLETIEATTKTGDGNNAPLSEKIFEKCIAVTNNGSVGYAYYQEKPFTCTHDVNPLYLKNHEINPYIALFLCTLIEKERFRWAYGRKWRPIRMPSSRIKLPVTSEGTPDWQFMEDYIKSLPYSKNI